MSHVFLLLVASNILHFAGTEGGRQWVHPGLLPHQIRKLSRKIRVFDTAILFYLLRLENIAISPSHSWTRPTVLPLPYTTFLLWRKCPPRFLMTGPVNASGRSILWIRKIIAKETPTTQLKKFLMQKLNSHCKGL